MPHTPHQELAAQLVAAGRRLDALGLVPARDGNISARNSGGPGPGDRILVTATGRRIRSLTEADLVDVDLDGRVHGPGRPSTELGMHLAVYRLRPDVGAVIHAHPPVAVGFASAGLGLTDCLMPEVAMSLGAVPLTPYATPGTPEIEAAIAEAARGHEAFLLANHGAVTLGASVDEALDRMETLEHFARIALVTRLLGGPKPLGRAEVEALEALRRRAGDPRPVTCDPAEGPRPAPETPSDLPPDLARVVAEAVRAVLDASGPDRG
jgi:L-fuculose-phosphate aldolase